MRVVGLVTGLDRRAIRPMIGRYPTIAASNTDQAREKKPVCSQRFAAQYYVRPSAASIIHGRKAVGACIERANRLMLEEPAATGIELPPAASGTETNKHRWMSADDTLSPRYRRTSQLR
jgi:hypothetical protein